MKSLPVPAPLRAKAIFCLFFGSALLCASALTLAAEATPITVGLDRSTFDPQVRMQDDLFRAVNGRWLASTEIPADKSSYGIFIQLRDRSDQQVRAIVDDMATRPQPAGSIGQKVGEFYASFTNTDAIDKAGLAPLTPLLAEIDAISSMNELAQWQGRVQGRIGTPIVLDVIGDFADPTVYRVVTWQGGLGLPDRDYYLKQDDAGFAKARSAYDTYLITLSTLIGDKAPAEAAKRTMAIEQRLAQLHWDKVDNRNPAKLYNPLSVQALVEQAPGFAWQSFFTAAQMPAVKQLSVSQPSTTIGVARLYAEVPLADWKTYFRLRTADTLAQVLPKPFRVARFAFRGTALSGATAERPRWQQGINALNEALGEAVGQLYVARHVPPEHKARMLVLIGNLLAAYRESIDQLTWMTPATKAEAQRKLAKYGTKVSYPDTWRDYSPLVIRADDALGNALRAAEFEWRRTARKAGGPVDRKEWGITPQTVNAYYTPLLNEIVFPAAILQPPFFDLSADDAVNYGAIGAIIGHEISHGFDDAGSQFDGDGRLRNWWTAEDRKAFEAIGEQLVSQFGSYEPLPGRKLNGKLTLGENIADLSGLQVAYKAYVRSLGGKPAAVMDGASGTQRFFLGWAQAWREKSRDERQLMLLTNDPHAPPRFRANGAAVNHDGFHEAFATKPGDGMFKPAEQRIRIW